MTVWFYKARSRWRYEFQHKGRPYGGYCLDDHGQPVTSRRAAEAAERRERERAKKAGPEIRAKPAPGAVTLATALSMLTARATPGRNAETNQLTYMREILAWFGPETPVAEIEGRVWDYIAWARRQPVRVWTGGRRKRTAGAKFWKDTDRTRSDSTINRYLDCLRKACRLAHEARNPVTQARLVPAMPLIPELDEPDALPRPVDADDVVAIANAAAPHIADAIGLCVLMGFRKAEVFSLTVGHIARDCSGVWLHGRETKGGRGEFMPASEEAAGLLRRLVKQARERGVEHLIVYRRERKDGNHEPWRPIKDPRKAWRSALKAAGVPAHKFHELKATFTTELAKRVSAKYTRDLSRHKSAETTDRYIRLADEAKREAVSTLGQTAFGKHFAAQNPAQESRTVETVDTGKEAKPLERLVGATGFEPATPRPPDLGAPQKVVEFQRRTRDGRGQK